MNQKISLFYCEGSSNKEYHAELVPSGTGFVVNFRYGRRGSALKCDTKTPTPLPYAEALRVYERLVAEKMKKGYSPAPDGLPYQATPLEQHHSGLQPQLLNAVDDADDLVRYLDHDDFVLQEKYDGMRVLIRVESGSVEGFNRRGLKIALPVAVAFEALSAIGPALLDGELVGTRYYAFDLLEHEGRDVRREPYRTRRALLSGVVARCSTAAIYAAPTHSTRRAKYDALEEVRSRGREGVVLKHDGAPYTAGRPASGGSQLKYKLVASATCRVASVSTNRRSVALQLADDSGTWRGVGKVTIPPNHEIPRAGALVEVRYLYAFRDGALFQPVYCGQRDDAELDAATLAQLKYKPEDEQPSAA